MNVFGIRVQFTPGRPKPPEVNPAYRAWIRKFPCIACGSTRCVEAMHSGPHGTSQKADDKRCLPVCLECHQTGKNAWHKIGRRDWEVVHEVDIESEIEFHNHLWELKKGKAA